MLKHLPLPLGTVLKDGTTYRITEKDFPALDERSRAALRIFEKMLALTDGKGHVVGGILFYGRYDLQAWIFPEYRGKGYMSAIHKNGILAAELRKKQQVTIDPDALESLEDLEMKLHLLSLIGLKPANEERLKHWRDLRLEHPEWFE